MSNGYAETAVEYLTEQGDQSSDDWSDSQLTEQVENAVWATITAYADEHSRPGCSCEDCTDNTCPNKESN